jgi:predicted lactoylglutathione lyase
MNKQIFVNLPVKDLARAKAFYAALGYSFDERFGNEHGGCVIVGDCIYTMLLTETFFQSLTPKALADVTRSTSALISLSCDSREEVDTLVAKAVAAGGRAHEGPDDHGFMYSHAFDDPDGNGWGLFWMGAPPECAAA